LKKFSVCLGLFDHKKIRCSGGDGFAISAAHFQNGARDLFYISVCKQNSRNVEVGMRSAK
jgi:hypothetical protein